MKLRNRIKRYTEGWRNHRRPTPPPTAATAPPRRRAPAQRETMRQRQARPRPIERRAARAARRTQRIALNKIIDRNERLLDFEDQQRLDALRQSVARHPAGKGR